MINLDDVQEGIKELERAAKRGLVGAMISEYPQEDRRYDSPEYLPFWAAAQDLNMPLSLHTATEREGRSGSAGATSVRDASRRATKVVLPANRWLKGNVMLRRHVPLAQQLPYTPAYAVKRSARNAQARRNAQR